MRALEKRPYTQERLKKLIYTIERDIQRRKASELTSSEVGDIVMARLRNFDKVAYIRFASVYRAFEDVQTFQKGAQHSASQTAEGVTKRLRIPLFSYV